MGEFIGALMFSQAKIAEKPGAFVQIFDPVQKGFNSQDGHVCSPP